MAASKLDKFWLLVMVALVTIILVGGVIAFLRFSPARPVEIVLPQDKTTKGDIFVDGAVTVPGYYALFPGDSVDSLLKAAGGLSNSANISGIQLYIPASGSAEPQRVNINRAEPWLLEALPGIGETLAVRIVEYRQQNGLFRSTEELAKVAGIGPDKYLKIKDKITVSD